MVSKIDIVVKKTKSNSRLVRRIANVGEYRIEDKILDVIVHDTFIEEGEQ